MKQFLLLAVVSLSLSPAHVLAQPAETGAPAAPKIETKTFDDWIVRCPVGEGAAGCDAAQLLVEPKSKQRVLSLSVAYDTTRAAHVVRIVTPLGIWLPHGVTVIAGEKKIENVVIRRCEPFGCVVEGLLDPDLEAAMRKGGEAKVVVFDQAKKPLDLKFSLKGFAEAEDHMTAATKKAKPAGPAPALAPAQP